MAVLVTPLTSKMKLRFQTGVNDIGMPVYKNKTISKVKIAASDENVFDTAVALSELCGDSLNAINRIDDADLAEDI